MREPDRYLGVQNTGLGLPSNPFVVRVGMSRSKKRPKWNPNRVKSKVRQLEHQRARRRQKRDNLEDSPKRENPWERWDVWSWT